ncbi:nucleotidyl transferase AbiEii/AbiGii toxin family protein [Streptomyces sp. NPDC051940]|uniref:nucleotidyl transferase AbiEii/AbiGii toxin family protein n=1 Tax=Streptomyces sp. NPDC051940 TaxID=3155675 RepID=UPI00341AF5AB
MTSGPAAHRAALDHVLAVIAAQPWSEALVLRGSMAMLAWAGAAARPPADLDFVVRPSLAVPVDPLDPYPYLPSPAAVQQWPEALDGAGAYEFWREEELETGGLRVAVPPEGLEWVIEPEEEQPPYRDLLHLLTEHPAPGVRFEPGSAELADWDYDYVFGPSTGPPSVRLLIPYEADDGHRSRVQLDFAADEELPEPPVDALVPRADGRGSTLIPAAGRELSLAWKLLWLRTDAAAEDVVRTKDLYDAVLLAEHPATRMTPCLLRRVLGQEPLDTAAVRGWRADGPLPGDPRAWTERLARVLEGW